RARPEARPHPPGPGSRGRSADPRAAPGAPGRGPRRDGSHGPLRIDGRGAADPPALCRTGATAAHLLPDRPRLEDGLRPDCFWRPPEPVSRRAAPAVALRPHPLLPTAVLLLRLHEGDRARRAAPRARPGAGAARRPRPRGTALRAPGRA